MSLRIEHRLGVPAPAEAVWQVIADVTAWPDWNPLYPMAEGALRIGATLTLEVAVPGRARRTIRPVILDWVPNEQILWRLSLLGGLVRTTRYLEIERLSETGCILANGEIFAGPLGELVAGRMQRDVRAGFAAMGEAAKARALASWRGDGADPTLAP
jgi:hypothetical protein